MRLTPDTVRVGIVGHPVAHSRSPALHNEVHRRLGIDAHYLAMDVAPGALPGTLTALRRLGWRGVNVTIPHKQAACEAADHLTDEARLIGAVNVLHLTDDGLVGDNTDARGWLASLQQETGWAGGRALVFGTGGAARAVVVALGRSGAEVVVAGRRPGAVADLVALAGRAGATRVDAVDLDEDRLQVATASVGLVVNATPLGMHGEALPGPLHRLGSEQIASDLVYSPPLTPFLASAAESGAVGHGGLGMLVHQAALGFARWHGVAPPVAAFAAAAGR